MKSEDPVIVQVDLIDGTVTYNGRRQGADTAGAELQPIGCEVAGECAVSQA
jgi:hypothetical protein